MWCSYSSRFHGKAVDIPVVRMRKCQGKKEGVLHVEYYLEGRLAVEELGLGVGAGWRPLQAVLAPLGLLSLNGLGAFCCWL